MVCDFVVYTYLEIKHKGGVAYIELDKKQEWYCDCLEPSMDSDDEEPIYQSRCEDYYNSFLKPGFEPIMIYDGEHFLKQQYIHKYFNLIQQKSEGKLKYWRDVGFILNITDIQQIRKIEIREKT
jgi:hypothetical protein